MRRRHDDWINATHILKAAGFDKPARTRILEREVQKENHEKVQGGYGKYQGALMWGMGNGIITDICKARGFPWSKEKLWLNETMSTKSFARSSNSYPATSALHLLRNIPPTSQKCLRNLRFQNGEAVSQEQRTSRRQR